MSPLLDPRSSPHRRAGLLLAVSIVLLLGVCARPLLGFAARDLPEHARYGKLTRFAHPYATIDGKALHLSPGARIYNEQNLIIMPAAMVQSAQVLYRLDNSGELSAIWILTQEEARARAPRTPLTKPASATAPAPTAR